ncbi:hypothetical protein BJI48_01510 [Helicobacter sp. 11S02596-1]|nr:hypothetical protein BJI48_01510 [Helicobacter sp. 11S02596-1]
MCAIIVRAWQKICSPAEWSSDSLSESNSNNKTKSAVALQRLGGRVKIFRFFTAHKQRQRQAVSGLKTLEIYFQYPSNAWV